LLFLLPAAYGLSRICAATCKPLHFSLFKSSLALYSHLWVSYHYLFCVSILFLVFQVDTFFNFFIRTFFNMSPSALHTCFSHLDVYILYVYDRTLGFSYIHLLYLSLFTGPYLCLKVFLYHIASFLLSFFVVDHWSKIAFD